MAAARAYLLLIRMWSRASAQYPASLAVLTVTQFAATGLDFAAIAIVFAHTRALAGFSLPEVMFLYGTSGTAFALADVVFGNIDRLSQHVRRGTFDVMLVRPVSALAQVAAEDFSPRRLGSLVQSGGVLVVSVATLRIDWDAGRVLAVPLMIAVGTVIYAALWIGGSSLQFVAGEPAELVNSLTYGGRTLNEYPLAIYGRDAVRLLTYVVPLAFVNWYPAMYVLDHPDPFGLPGVLRFAGPAVAVLLTALAALAWRSGIRHYRSTGS